MKEAYSVPSMVADRGITGVDVRARRVCRMSADAGRPAEIEERLMDWQQAVTWMLLGGIDTAWIIAVVHFWREQRRLWK